MECYEPVCRLVPSVLVLAVRFRQVSFIVEKLEILSLKVPYYSYSVRTPQNPSVMIQAPKLGCLKGSSRPRKLGLSRSCREEVQW